MLEIAVIYLAAAIIAVPIAKRLGLGSVLGYLLAGKLFAAHDEESLHTLANLWGDDRSYGVAVKQRLEVLKQVLMNDKEQQEKLNTCSGGEAQQAFSQDEIATNIANKGLGDA